MRVSELEKPGDDSGLPLSAFAIRATVTDTELPAVAVRFNYFIHTFASTPTLFGMEVRPSGEAEVMALTATVIREFPLAGWERAARGHVEERLRGPMTLYTHVARAMGYDVGDGDTLTVETADTSGLDDPSLPQVFLVRHGSGTLHAGVTARGSGVAHHTEDTAQLTDAAHAVITPSGIPSGEAFGEPKVTVGPVPEDGPDDAGLQLPPSAADFARLGPKGIVDTLYPGLEDSTAPSDMRTYNALLRMATAAAIYRRYTLDGVRDPTSATARDMGVSVATARSLLHRARKESLLSPVAPRGGGTQPVIVQPSREDQLRRLNQGRGRAIITRAPVEDAPTEE